MEINEGQEYYTICPSYISGKSISEGNPFVIQHRVKGDYTFDEAAISDLGFVYDTPQAAMDAAYEYYYKHKFGSFGRPFNYNEKNYTVTFDPISHQINIMPMTFATSEVFFGSKIDAQNALNSIGVVNFCRYVLGLKGQGLAVMTETEI